MTINELLSVLTVGEFSSLAVLVLFILSVLVEISPLKINPWRSIGKFVGRAINGEIMDQVETLNSKVNELQEKINVMEEANAERDAKTARRDILRFGDEILHEVKHSKESFDDILQSCTEYEHYCRAHPEFKNHLTVHTMELINHTYDKCLQENSFLWGSHLPE